MSRRIRRAALLVLAVVGLALLAGCTTIKGLIDTENALDRAGFTDVDVNASTDNGFDTVEITVRPPAEGSAASEAERAAEVVWTTFPLRFDLVRIKLLGPDDTTTSYTSSEMREIFGPRSPDLDEKELGDEFLKVGVGVAVVLLGGGLFVVGAVVLVIVLAVRSSRKAKLVTPPPWPPVVR